MSDSLKITTLQQLHGTFKFCSERRTAYWFVSAPSGGDIMSHRPFTFVHHCFHPSWNSEYIPSLWLSPLSCSDLFALCPLSLFVSPPIPVFTFSLLSPWCKSLLHEDLICVCKLILSSSLPVDFKRPCHSAQLLTCPPSARSVLSVCCYTVCLHTLCTCYQSSTDRELNEMAAMCVCRIANTASDGCVQPLNGHTHHSKQGLWLCFIITPVYI